MTMTRIARAILACLLSGPLLAVGSLASPGERDIAAASSAYPWEVTAYAISAVHASVAAGYRRVVITVAIKNVSRQPLFGTAVTWYNHEWTAPTFYMQAVGRGGFAYPQQLQQLQRGYFIGCDSGCVVPPGFQVGYSAQLDVPKTIPLEGVRLTFIVPQGLGMGQDCPGVDWGSVYGAWRGNVASTDDFPEYANYTECEVASAPLRGVTATMRSSPFRAPRSGARGRSTPLNQGPLALKLLSAQATLICVVDAGASSGAATIMAWDLTTPRRAVNNYGYDLDDGRGACPLRYRGDS